MNIYSQEADESMTRPFKMECCLRRMGQFVFEHKLLNSRICLFNREKLLNEMDGVCHLAPIELVVDLSLIV